MKRFCYSTMSCIGLILLFSIGLWLVHTPKARADVGCPDPSTGCADDPSQDTTLQSNTRPFTKSEQYFVTDTGYQLDQYLFRNDVITTSGRLTFAIDIDRYYSPWITTTALITDGLVDPNIITDLINNHLLPPTATLTLEVYDIDNSATGCVEVDHVYLNSQLLLDPTTGITATLSGKDQDWETWSIDVPIQSLRFPTVPGAGGGRPSALNEVAIDINTQCPVMPWAVKVDWGTLAIASPLHRPIAFVHGFAEDFTMLEPFDNFATADGIPTFRKPITLSLGILPISTTARMLEPFITQSLQTFGVDKVNVFAHSKGGLISRYLLRRGPGDDMVENLFTFGSPHHGHEWSTGLGMILCPRIPAAINLAQCQAAADEMMPDRIRTEYNYNRRCLANGTNCVAHRYRKAPGVFYYTIVGPEAELDIGERSATYPWNAGNLMYPNNNIQVDSLLPLDHIRITQDRTAYDAAINLLINNPPPRKAINSATQTLTTESMELLQSSESTSWRSTVTNQLINLEAGETRTVTVSIQSDVASFYIFSIEPLTATLIDPTGDLINPTVAENVPNISYNLAEGNLFNAIGWTTLYQIANPISGQWQVVLTTTTANDLSLYVAVESTSLLQAMPDKVSYLPGELVTLQASLQENSTPITGAIISGTVEMPDGSAVQLTFHDDGITGDTTPNDGLYSAQFNAPNVNSRPWITLRATNGSIARLKEFSIDVVGPTATLQQVTGEQAVDTNSNGLYDVLEIALLLNVQTIGSYSIQAVLADSNDDILTMDVQNTGSLAAGSQPVTLRFSGEDLRNAGVDGPYTLTNLFISYNDPTVFSPFTVAVHENLYTTASYSHREFEGYLLKLLNSSEQVVDLDSDGLYDELVFNVQLDVLAPGAYEWDGQLVASNGTDLGWVGGSGNLDSQTPMVFTFAGTEINKKGANGPYRLQNVSVARTSGAPLSMSWYKVHTTAAYTAAQFEPPLACGGPVPPVVNAAFEQRAVELTNIERANQGLPPLKRAELLMGSARYHANDMKVDNYFVHDSHDRVNGVLTFVCNWDERIDSFYPTQWFLAENLAGAFSSPESVMDGWMNSPGHRANILASYREIGVGYDVNWVQNFRLHPDVYPLVINGEAAATTATNVTLYAYGDWTEIRLRNNGGAWSAWQPFTNTLSWTLDPTFGLQTVEAEMRDGSATVTSSDTIEYAAPIATPTPTDTPTNTPLPPPAAPILNQPDNPDNDGNYTVTWSSVVDATGYELQESHGVVILYNTIYSGPATSFAVTDRSATTHCYKVRSLRDTQSGPWSNQVCLTVAAPTPTPTLTVAPTNTPTPTPTGNPVSSAVIYVGSDSGGTVAGITFADEDILAFDTATSAWSLLFDGSDVGLTANVDALHLESDGSLLLSLSANVTLPDVGAVTWNDIVRFTPTSLGETTAGAFAWVLDGSDVELETASENIDSIGRAPDGRLVVSTAGGFVLTPFSGDDSDLIVFNATSLGATSAGSWELYFQGGDVELTNNGEDIYDVWIDSTTGNLYLNTYLGFSAVSTNSLAGDEDDIFVCVPSSLGATTTCTFYLFWDGDTYGFNFLVDSMSIGGAVPPITASAQNRQLTEEELLSEKIYLPLVAR